MHEIGILGAVVCAVWCVGCIVKAAQGMSLSQLRAELLKDQKVLTRAGTRRMPRLFAIILYAVPFVCVGYVVGFWLGGLLKYVTHN